MNNFLQPEKEFQLKIFYSKFEWLPSLVIFQVKAVLQFTRIMVVEKEYLNIFLISIIDIITSPLFRSIGWPNCFYSRLFIQQIYQIIDCLSSIFWSEQLSPPLPLAYANMCRNEDMFPIIIHSPVFAHFLLQS